MNAKNEERFGNKDILNEKDAIKQVYVWGMRVATNS